MLKLKAKPKVKLQVKPKVMLEVQLHVEPSLINKSVEPRYKGACTPQERMFALPGLQPGFSQEYLISAAMELMRARRRSP